MARDDAAATDDGRAAEETRFVDGVPDGEVARVVIGDDTFAVGDAVLVKAPGSNERYVGRIVSVAVRDGAANARLCWYYRPQETKGGRKRFHGVKELFASDHYDWVSVNTIDARCYVWSIAEYQALDAVTEYDFYARFMYLSSKGEFRPATVAVFCACMEPYNPDRMMVMCERCEEWFHPDCVGETQASVSRATSWNCPRCRANAAAMPPPPSG